jgi:prophage regulatory protein
MPTKKTISTDINTLPLIGFSRWAQIAPFVGYGREAWRQMVNAGRAPQPVRLSPTSAFYRNEEIYEWLKDPVSYRVPVAENKEPITANLRRVLVASGDAE